MTTGIDLLPENHPKVVLQTGDSQSPFGLASLSGLGFLQYSGAPKECFLEKFQFAPALPQESSLVSPRFMFGGIPTSA